MPTSELSRRSAVGIPTSAVNTRLPHAIPIVPLCFSVRSEMKGSRYLQRQLCRVGKKVSACFRLAGDASVGHGGLENIVVMDFPVREETFAHIIPTLELHAAEELFLKFKAASSDFEAQALQIFCSYDFIAPVNYHFLQVSAPHSLSCPRGGPFPV